LRWGDGAKAANCDNAPPVTDPTVQSSPAVSRKRKGKKVWTCDDCFFRCRGLCALDVKEPCSTFRLNRPEGLVPPRQPALLLRDPPDDPAEGIGGEGVPQTA
jgi:hypothetical protein